MITTAALLASEPTPAPLPLPRREPESALPLALAVEQGDAPDRVGADPCRAKTVERVELAARCTRLAATRLTTHTHLARELAETAIVLDAVRHLLTGSARTTSAIDGPEPIAGSLPAHRHVWAAALLVSSLWIPCRREDQHMVCPQPPELVAALASLAADRLGHVLAEMAPPHARPRQ
ncbi:hypothetical protein AB0C02_25645 [Micromonospora sp. NPDC048999]|uniref:hypothetical protein n=1 Tax=Micromonospora sp. NPDC048999 TaxID=3155391 RepID=UPI0033CBC257